MDENNSGDVNDEKNIGNIINNENMLESNQPTGATENAGLTFKEIPNISLLEKIEKFPLMFIDKIISGEIEKYDKILKQTLTMVSPLPTNHFGAAGHAAHPNPAQLSSLPARKAVGSVHLQHVPHARGWKNDLPAVCV